MSTASAPPPRWHLPRIAAFRFVFLYLGLYNLPFPFGRTVPGTGWLEEAWERIWRGFVPWVGKHILRVPGGIRVFDEGSGDTTFDYVKVLTFAALALLGAGCWTAADPRRTKPENLNDGLRVYVRYALAFTMLHYGLQKVFPLQFATPNPDRLMQTYGESSPMGLLWTFMGASPLYRVFGGLGEIGGGVLLLWRRTTTLGALVVIAVMTNVVMLNLGYDVPVKLYSIHLLSMAIFLAWQDIERLGNLLVLNRPTEPVVFRVPFDTRRKEHARVAAKSVFVAYLLGSTLYTNWSAQWQYGQKVPRPALYGVWEVETFTRNGQAVPPLATDGTRWKRMTINTATYLRVRSMTGAKQGFSVVNDGARLTLRESADASTSTLTFERTDPEHLVITGEFKSEPISVQLKRVDDSNFLLLNRGFHWITEVPLNR